MIVPQQKTARVGGLGSDYCVKAAVNAVNYELVVPLTAAMMVSELVVLSEPVALPEVFVSLVSELVNRLDKPAISELWESSLP